MIELGRIEASCTAVRAPSTLCTVPVMWLASLPARKAITSAISLPIESSGQLPNAPEPSLVGDHLVAPGTDARQPRHPRGDRGLPADDLPVLKLDHGADLR